MSKCYIFDLDGTLADCAHRLHHIQKEQKDWKAFFAAVGADIVIGRRIYAGSIIDFIEQRSYVDYVAGIKLFSSDDGQTFTLAPAGGPDGDGVGSDWPDAVLVAARQHQIDLIRDEIFAADEFKGVNYMKIELDFVVG